MEKFLESIGFSSVALTVLGAILTPLSLILIKYLKKNFKLLKNANSNLEDQKKLVINTLNNIKSRQNDIENENLRSREKILLHQEQERDDFENRILKEFEDFKNKYFPTIQRAFERIDENKVSLTGLLDRITSSMTLYDNKLVQLEKRLQDGSISRIEYHRELDKLKKALYKTLNECQAEIKKTGLSLGASSDLKKATQDLISINQRLLDYEEKFFKHDEKLDYYEKLLQKNVSQMNDTEHKNIERHKITKQIITRSLAETREENKKTISKLNEIVNVHKKNTDKKLKALYDRQKKTDNKLNNNGGLGKVIKIKK